ncbi:MAG TPA: regulatory protein RecX [Acidobacteriota bacterium]|nr:regulatory protein RecX [Acidobacteriota bacterium]
MPLRPDRAASEDAAKEAALRLLERGPRTEREIVDRLLGRGFVPDAVERAVERLRRVSLLDDRAFVKAFVRTELARRPQSRRLLETKLRRRGVPAALIQEVERLLAEDADLAERRLGTERERAMKAVEALRRRYAGRPDEERRRKTAHALLRRGFSWDTIRDLMGDESTGDTT